MKGTNENGGRKINHKGVEYIYKRLHYNLYLGILGWSIIDLIFDSFNPYRPSVIYLVLICVQFVCFYRLLILLK